MSRDRRLVTATLALVLLSGCDFNIFGSAGPEAKTPLTQSSDKEVQKVGEVRDKAEDIFEATKARDAFLKDGNVVDLSTALGHTPNDPELIAYLVATETVLGNQGPALRARQQLLNHIAAERADIGLFPDKKAELLEYSNRMIEALGKMLVGGPTGKIGQPAPGGQDAETFKVYCDSVAGHVRLFGNTARFSRHQQQFGKPCP